MLRIELLSGPRAGHQLHHTDPVLTFGRAADNTLSFDEPHLSRHHGDLRFQDGAWVLVNHSPNGTKLGRRTVTDQTPRPLRSGQIISVGGKKLFAAHFAEEAAGQAAAEPAPEAESTERAGPKMSRRAKLWIGIGVYMAAVLAVIVVFSTLGVGEPGDGASGPAPQLTDEQIAREVRRAHRLPEDQPIDQRKAASHLEQARATYNRLGSKPDALYEAHRHFKLALAYGGDRSLEGVDQLKFERTRRKLIRQLTETYRRAYAQLRNKQWRAAEKTLRKLTEMYPRPGSRLFENVQKQLSYVLGNKPGSGGGFR